MAALYNGVAALGNRATALYNGMAALHNGMAALGNQATALYNGVPRSGTMWLYTALLNL